MAKRYTPMDFDPIVEEIGDAPPRSAILVAQALIEHQLEEVISASLRKPTSEAEKKILFSDRGLMGSFSEKIWAAYFMGLIGPVTRRDFDLIRQMRNECAHNMNPVSFTEGRIKDWFGQLRRGGDQREEVHRGSPQQIFAETVHELVLGLILRSMSNTDFHATDRVRRLSE